MTLGIIMFYQTYGELSLICYKWHLWTSRLHIMSFILVVMAGAHSSSADVELFVKKLDDEDEVGMVVQQSYRDRMNDLSGRQQGKKSWLALSIPTSLPLYLTPPSLPSLPLTIPPSLSPSFPPSHHPSIPFPPPSLSPSLPPSIPLSRRRCHFSMSQGHHF